VEADQYEAFRPLVGVGEGFRMGFLDRRIAWSVMAGLSGELGLELDMGRRNDLRDWDRIQDFANRFSQSLHE